MRTIVLLLLALTLLGGCASLFTPGAGRERVIPGESEFDAKTTTTLPDGTVVEEHVKSKATTPGYEGDSLEKLKMPGLHAQPNGAGTGSGGAGFSLPSLAGMPLGVYLLGALFIAAAVIVGKFMGWKYGALVGAVGLSGIAAVHGIATYPWVVWAVLAVGLAVVGFLVYKWYKGDITTEHLTSAKTTLKTVVAGVESAGTTAAAAVKAKVSELAKATGQASTVKAEVSEAKNGG